MTLNKEKIYTTKQSFIDTAIPSALGIGLAFVIAFIYVRITNEPPTLIVLIFMAMPVVTLLYWITGKLVERRFR